MKSIINEHLSLILKECLFDVETNYNAFDDYDSVLIESSNHSVCPLVYNKLKDCIMTDRDKWSKTYYQIISNNIRNQNAHRQLHSMLTEAGVSYVVLKGMASAKYYPDSSLRAMGDVDFLVSQEDLDRTKLVLENNGLLSTDANNGFHIAYKGKQMTWELHWAPPGVPKDGEAADKVRFYLSDIIEKAQPYDGCMVPSDFHHGVVLLLHSASHMTTTGMGLRHLCDWAVFVNSLSNEEFIDMFETPLREMGLWEYARVLTAVSIKYLGVKQLAWTDGVADETVDLIMEDIMDSGNFGVKDKQRINQAKFMRDDATRGVARGGMISTLFRNLTVRAKKAMPITAKVPILLPIGWVYVGVRHLFWVATGRRHKINVKQTLEGAQKRGAVYKELHLFEVE